MLANVFAPDPSSPEPRTLVIEHLEIRPNECQVLVSGRRARLTVREFEIFFALVQNRDRVVRRQELYDMVWGGQMAYRDRSVDVFVRKVRRKLAEVSPEWIYIHTHFGIGYRMSIEPASSAGTDL
ncbi:MAG TPA: winged helix-turn-helix domain-containing protein [Baekduia sp.]|nr:winged helix-turn-helix domain-containing protein [Baekduia sp.]